jgi:cell division septation protein DedD
MRFEINAGGWFLIAVGLFGLSAVVFVAGIYAGYVVARSTAPEATQAASVYPLPNPPPAPDFAKAPAKSSDQVASTLPGSNAPVTKTNPSDSGAASLAMDKSAGPVAAASSRAVANAAASVSSPKTAPSDTALEEKTGLTKPALTNPPAKYASATDASAGRHKPFNIQLDAAMDRTNAEQMTARLQKLGYHAFMIPTDISGQTWWRVRVGPYQSQEEASTAEQELRAKYRDTYTP